VDFDASRPIWLQLREEFTRRIVIGRWAPGKQIPGVRELAVELGVNPNTVQRTLAELERDGLCRSERAVGRFAPAGAAPVSPPPPNIQTCNTPTVIIPEIPTIWPPAI